MNGWHKRVFAALGGLLIVGWSSTLPAITAFPDAVGYGRNSLGGRGGKLLFVTTTADNGDNSNPVQGSLRWACTQSGPRIVIFRIGGLITVTKWFIPINDPYITIAGQTAPGDGICLAAKSTAGKVPLHITNSHDVVVRYLRIRPGTDNGAEGHGALVVWGGGKNIIIDHCSLSWASDEQIQLYSTEDSITQFTIQKCISAEALPAIRSTDCQCGGMTGGTANINGGTWYRNLFAHTSHRNPSVGQDAANPVSIQQVVNNVGYNLSNEFLMINPYHFSADASGKIQVNVVGNFYKSGPNGFGTNRQEVHIGYGVMVYPGAGATGNRGINRTSDTQNEWLVCGTTSFGAAPTAWRSATPFDAANMPPALSASSAYDSVLADCGANRLLNGDGTWRTAIDPVDTRIMADVRNGTGTVKANHTVTYPAYAAGTPYADTDNDGMGDLWEQKIFGNLTTAQYTDATKTDTDRDGYHDLEEFLNGTNPKDGTTDIHQGRVGRHGDVKRTQPITPVYNLQGRRGVKRVGGYGENGGCGVRVFGDGVVVRMNR